MFYIIIVGNKSGKDEHLRWWTGWTFMNNSLFVWYEITSKNFQLSIDCSGGLPMASDRQDFWC